MSKFGFNRNAWRAGSGIAAALCAGVAFAADDAKSIPNFMGATGWNSAGGMEPMAGPPPVGQDQKVKYTGNNTGRQSDGSYEQPTWRYADLNNPNLTDFAKAGLKKANDMVDAGFAMYNRTSRCWQPGIPSLNLSPGRTYFIQTPKEVKIIWQRDQIVRNVHMNVQHTANPKPSWNGESIGHYEGDTLVVDTIGQTTNSFVDLFRTPHSDKLHVIERFRLIEGGNKLEVEVTVDDPVAFKQPWKFKKVWEKAAAPAKPVSSGDVTGTYNEEIRCMDGELVNPFNQAYADKLEALPTDKNGAEQKLLAGGG